MALLRRFLPPRGANRGRVHQVAMRQRAGAIMGRQNSHRAAHGYTNHSAGPSLLGEVFGSVRRALFGGKGKEELKPTMTREMEYIEMSKRKAPIYSDNAIREQHAQTTEEILRILPREFSTFDRKSGRLVPRQVNRNALDRDKRELYDLHSIFFNAVRNGEVASPEEFRSYLKKWLEEHEQNPQYAKIAYDKFMGSFRGPRATELRVALNKFAQIRRGVAIDKDQLVITE